MMLAARNIFLAARRKPRLPYDAEVEYLESTGPQWIDTGYAPDCRNDVIDAQLEVTAVVSYGAAFGVAETIGGGTKFFGLRRNGTTDMWQALWGGPSPSLALSTPYTVHYEYGVNKCTINDAVGNGNPTIVYTMRLALFALNASASAIGRNKMKLFSFSARRNGVLVRDFIPVRFTNELGVSEGAMYDRATKQLFRNQGTGAFLYGADKTA